MVAVLLGLCHLSHEKMQMESARLRSCMGHAGNLPPIQINAQPSAPEGCQPHSTVQAERAAFSTDDSLDALRIRSLTCL